LSELSKGVHQFGGAAEFCAPEFEDDARSFDERAVRLRDFDRSEGLCFLYVYDFGDKLETRRRVRTAPRPRRDAAAMAAAFDGANNRIRFFRDVRLLTRRKMAIGNRI
jgi:hypothetical protein